MGSQRWPNLWFLLFGGIEGKNTMEALTPTFEPSPTGQRKSFLWRLLTDVPSGIRQGGERFFLVTNFATLISGVGHASFIPLFGALGVMPLFFYNFGSVALFAIAWYINRKGHCFSAIILSIAEYTGHAWLAVQLLGWDFGFQYYMIGWCFVPFLAPEGNRGLKFAIFFFNAADFIASSSRAAISPLPADAWQLAYAPYVNAFNVLFFCAGFAFAFFHFRNLVDQADAIAKSAYARSEWLLHNILPESIAERLKTDSRLIADAHVSATVLFLDIADFTPMAETMKPRELVEMLNAVFSELDRLAQRHGVEKIKTIGDAYMVAAGVPVHQPDHAERIGGFALDAVESINQFTDHHGRPLRVRVGIDTGSVVAGVIGARKFIYDMWGDMVNTASRMGSHGVPNRIHTTKGYADAVRGSFVFEPRGIIYIKGKGEMETYFLNGPVPGTNSQLAVPCLSESS